MELFIWDKIRFFKAREKDVAVAERKASVRVWMRVLVFWIEGRRALSL